MKQIQTLGDFTRFLRNSVTHFNWEVVPDGSDTINALKLWDECDHVRIYEITFTVKQLRAILERYIELINLT